MTRKLKSNEIRELKEEKQNKTTTVILRRESERERA